MKKFLTKNIVDKEINEKLLCYEKDIAEAISESLEIKTHSSAEMLEVFRGIRSQLSSLISGT